MTAEPVFINQKEAAALVGLSDVTIRRRISQGLLPAVRSGRCIRVRRADVLAMFEPIPSAVPRRRRSQATATKSR